jgi:hypothetical protein
MSSFDDDESESWPLRASDLDQIARHGEWEKLKCTTQPPMASYRKDGVRLNFYLSTGTVGSCLEHPTNGKTLLFRKKVRDVNTIFENPRQHTGKGYHTRKRKAS